MKNDYQKLIDEITSNLNSKARNYQLIPQEFIGLLLDLNKFMNNNKLEELPEHLKNLNK
jgi:hypothetical protein